MYDIALYAVRITYSSHETIIGGRTPLQATVSVWASNFSLQQVAMTTAFQLLNPPDEQDFLYLPHNYEPDSPSK